MEEVKITVTEISLYYALIEAQPQNAWNVSWSTAEIS